MPAASRCQSGPERKHIPSGMCCCQKDMGPPTTIVSISALDCSGGRRHAVSAGTDNQKLCTVHQSLFIPNRPMLQKVHRHTEFRPACSRAMDIHQRSSREMRWPTVFLRDLGPDPVDRALEVAGRLAPSRADRRSAVDPDLRLPEPARVISSGPAASTARNRSTRRSPVGPQPTGVEHGQVGSSKRSVLPARLSRCAGGKEPLSHGPSRQSGH